MYVNIRMHTYVHPNGCTLRVCVHACVSVSVCVCPFYSAPAVGWTLYFHSSLAPLWAVVQLPSPCPRLQVQLFSPGAFAFHSCYAGSTCLSACVKWVPSVLWTLSSFSIFSIRAVCQPFFSWSSVLIPLCSTRRSTRVSVLCPAGCVLNQLSSLWCFSAITLAPLEVLVVPVRPVLRQEHNQFPDWAS